MDANGNRQFYEHKYDGSFHWQQDTLQMSIEELGATSIQFLIFLSKSGTLWVDDVVFQN